jgi:hypothetical protein
MGIEDIQISEELETNAPSIKYRGDEGPRSPQQEQQMMMAQLEEAYGQYVDEMIEMGQEDSIMPLRQFIEQAMAEGQMAGGNPLPQDPTKPVNPFQPKPTGPVLPDRQMAARGGIMGADGRTGFLFGGIKKRIRKLIPNEVAKVAEVAAPFVAPFNPIAAGLMSGIGGFDRTGRIGSSLKSGLMTYGLGQGARYLGGADFQGLQNPFTRDAFSMPTGSGGIKNLFNKSKAPADMSKFNELGLGGSNPANVAGNTSNISLATGDGTAMEAFYKGGMEPAKIVAEQAKAFSLSDLPGLVKKNLMAAGLGNNLMTGLLVGGLGAGALMSGMTEEEQTEMDRGEGLDIEGIRTEVIEAMKDPTGDALKAIRIKYPFLGRQDTKDLSQLKAEGGRIGMAEGGIMDLGGMEKDYRAEGGFVPIGKAEKADDVPARLSVNEFVFTADAVRNAGGGDIDRGAEVMENMMKHLEQGGQVSDESQGMAGAQQMFETSERLSEVI